MDSFIELFCLTVINFAAKLTITDLIIAILGLHYFKMVNYQVIKHQVNFIKFELKFRSFGEFIDH